VEILAPEYRHQFDWYLNEIRETGESRGLMVVVTRSGDSDSRLGVAVTAEGIRGRQRTWG